jgi:hypothetical protein
MLLRRPEVSPFRYPPRPNPNISKNEPQSKPNQSGRHLILAERNESVEPWR